MQKFAICGSITTVLGILTIVVGIILGLIVFPIVVYNKVEDEVKLINGTEAWDRWVELPTIDYKIYFFNVTNPAEVQNGAKPILNEIGPYIYKEFQKKNDVVKKDVDTVSYDQTILFEFDEERSYPLSDEDELTVANLPLMSTIVITEKVAPLGLLHLNNEMHRLFDNPTDMFLRTTPKKFLFEGIRIHCDNDGVIPKIICAKIKQYAPKYLVPDGKDFVFSALGDKNNTVDGPYIVNTGENDVRSLGKILSWKKSPNIGKWKANSTCDAIRGTDATIFAPHANEKTVVDVFQTDICRSVTLLYEGDVKYKNILAHRYVARTDTLASSATKPENSCFCSNSTLGIVGDDKCPLDGALDLMSCTGAPVVLTFPHFYLSDKVYQDGVIGLAPDKESHQSFADLQPHTGSPLRGAKRGQINIFFRKVKYIKLTEKLTTTLMPTFWISEGIELNDYYVGLLNTKLLNNLVILDIVYWTIIGLGVLVTLISIVSLFLKFVC